MASAAIRCKKVRISNNNKMTKAGTNLNCSMSMRNTLSKDNRCPKFTSRTQVWCRVANTAMRKIAARVSTMRKMTRLSTCDVSTTVRFLSN